MRYSIGVPFVIRPNKTTILETITAAIPAMHSPWPSVEISNCQHAEAFKWHCTVIRILNQVIVDRYIGVNCDTIIPLARRYKRCLSQDHTVHKPKINQQRLWGFYSKRETKCTKGNSVLKCCEQCFPHHRRPRSDSAFERLRATINWGEAHGSSQYKKQASRRGAGEGTENSRSELGG